MNHLEKSESTSATGSLQGVRVDQATWNRFLESHGAEAQRSSASLPSPNASESEKFLWDSGMVCFSPAADHVTLLTLHRIGIRRQEFDDRRAATGQPPQAQGGVRH